MAAVRSTPISSTPFRSTGARTSGVRAHRPVATRATEHPVRHHRTSGANALAVDRSLDPAPRRTGSTPPRLRLVTTPPRPAAVVRPRPTAAVYRRRRLGVAVAAAALALVVAQAATVLGGHSLATPEHRPAAVVTVRPGDTVWSVAERLGTGTDTRAVADRLVRQLGTTVIQPGQRIRLAG